MSLASGVGVKVRPVNCDTVSASSKVTGVTQSERSTLPSVGRPVTVTARSLVSKAASVGVVMSIGVALLFSATVSEVGVVEGWPTACAPGTVSVPENSPLVAKVSVKRKPLGIVVGFPEQVERLKFQAVHIGGESIDGGGTDLDEGGPGRTDVPGEIVTADTGFGGQIDRGDVGRTGIGEQGESRAGTRVKRIGGASGGREMKDNLGAERALQRVLDGGEVVGAGQAGRVGGGVFDIGESAIKVVVENVGR